MPCQLSNHSKMDLSSLEPHVQGMYDFFDQKIGFKKPPTMHFDSDPNNQSNVLGKTAYYDPSSLEIHIFTDGRHPKDMLRSIAHELIHHQQNLEDRLNVGGYMGQGYYLENKKMKMLEQEAMLKGNALMREYEDTTKSEEMNEMSLKEWKNNELNKLLLEKFGILKEEKKTGKPDFLDLDKDGDKDESMKDAAEDKKMNEQDNDCTDENEEEMNEDLDDNVKAELEKGQGHIKRPANAAELKTLGDAGIDISGMTDREKIDAAEHYREEKKQQQYNSDRLNKGNKKLQEALKRIVNAKSITLKSSGKKIK